jgi:calcineurin-like phosphoesterase family protein
MATWFTSDPHFYHISIIKLCNRPFNNFEEMNETLIKNWNNAVHKNDTIYCQGDFALKCTQAQAQQILSRLNGKKILLVGNHDKVSIQLNGWDKILYADMIKDNHIRYYLSHYPLMQFPKSYVSVHGHCHGNLAQSKKRIDVGVDSNQYVPISFEQLRLKLLQYEEGDYPDSTVFK